jgi:hypothetical protein
MAMGLMLLAVGFSAVCELQPKILAEMFGLNVALAGLTDSLSSILLIIAPYCVVIAVFARKLSEFIEIARESRDLRTQIAAFFAKVAIYTAAIGVVLLMSTLWLVYLHLSYWGICINSPALYADGWCNVPDWVVAGLAILSNIFTEFGLWLFKRELSPYEAVIAGYSLLAVSFTLIAVLLSPNSNSLNALYRDRLGKAFLFMPQPTLQRHEELKPLDVNLSEFHGTCGPYHLINAALNVQNSKEANKRGRNADFFIFSKNFTGSKTTGYVKTAEIEKVESELDLATMMAISGAAASTGMGSQTHKVLTPIMAILNIRLGYWLHNPLKINKRKSLFGNFYFLAELFGLLNERRRAVYLTDGGHIENLGLYELLKRSCRVIIAVDSEADPELTFGSLHTLRRYARIDLGVEIDLPWQQIQAAGVASRSAVGRNQEGDAPDFVEVGEAGIAVDHAMRRQRRIQLVG